MATVYIEARTGHSWVHFTNTISSFQKEKETFWIFDEALETVPFRTGRLENMRLICF